MSTLEKIKKRFLVEPELAIDDHKKTCAECGGQKFWQARNSDSWNCETCQPPLSKAFVAARMGDGDHGIEFEAPSEASVVDEIELAMTVPWCPQCGCLRGTEKLYSDGRTETRCVRPACNALMPEWPLPLGPS